MTAASPGRRQVGIDNYGLWPLDLSPLDTLRWADAHGADGVAFSGITEAHRARLDAGALADLRNFAADRQLYLEWGGGQHIPRDFTTWSRSDLTAVNRRAAEEARALGVRVVRSCSGGLMRWDTSAPPTEALMRDTAGALQGLLPMLRDHGVVLAIETHFEFTSFELLRIFDMCEAAPGDALGICLDTMNLLTMLEHPVWAAERLLPWIVSTHIKDGGVLVGRAGLTTFPVPLGTGIIDLTHIIDRLDTLEPAVHLSVEDHGGQFELPIHDAAFLAQFPDVTGAELAALVAFGEETAGRPSSRPTDRADWPSVCEARIAGDLAALRRLARPGGTGAGSRAADHESATGPGGANGANIGPRHTPSGGSA
jgi:sugar phosphate isomerase/epimerase